MSNCFTQLCAAALLAFSLALGGAAQAETSPAGVIVVPSAYGMVETVERLKKDIAAKGITFFAEIDQGALAAVAGVPNVRPSVLLLFGNPPLGTQFLLANQQAGLDWPVRMLVYQDEKTRGIMVAWTDFAWIAKRHGIASQPAQFKMATEVAASIASAATAAVPR